MLDFCMFTHIIVTELYELMISVIIKADNAVDVTARALRKSESKNLIDNYYDTPEFLENVLYRIC